MRLAGKYLYKVDTPIPKIIASCCRGWPFSNSRLICSCSCLLIARGRPPSRPCALAAASPARVRSTINSRSISASADITWKKNRPIALLVSILSVKEWKWAPRSCNSDINATRFFTLRPSLSNFQTTRVSPLFTYFNARFRPGRFAILPLIRSSKMRSQFALVSALRWALLQS